MKGSNSHAVTAPAVVLIVSTGLVCVLPRSATAQDGPGVERVRTLYESAAYDDAMRALDAMANETVVPREQAEMVLRYRALCLLALDRNAEAETAVEQIVVNNPLYEVTAENAPPRLVKTFDRVRARVIPALARSEYAAAKDLFEKKQWTEAAERFERVVQLGTASAGPEDGTSDVADLTTLATGFLELSREHLSATNRGGAGNGSGGPASARPAGSAAAAEPVFSSQDAGVTPPVAIRQDVPPWHPETEPPWRQQIQQAREGRLEIVIGPTGDVQSAIVTETIDPIYDKTLLRAVKGWKYQPAVKDGVAVSFRRMLIIRLVPR
jgi:Gram-negative bacterial TonB protein C-terminal